MKITSISRQIHDKSRVNIAVDGSYLFSLDEYQIISLGINKITDYNQAEIDAFVEAGRFGKVYANSLEYCLLRPRSEREVRNYLQRKTLQSVDKKGNKKDGISQGIVTAVLGRLKGKGYIDDKKFAIFWAENRFVKKGISDKRLTMELKAKGVEKSIIDEVFLDKYRDDKNEIKKVINKKRQKYPDNIKLIQYLLRQGFSYDDIKSELESEDATLGDLNGLT